MKFCKQCDIETERCADGRCKPCKNARTSARHAANPERKRAAEATRYAANTEKVKATHAAYRAANREKINAWHRANSYKVKAYKAAWRKANPEKTRASIAAWRAANPDARRIHDQNRRARECENGGKLSKGLADKLLILQKGKCPCCNQPLGEDFHLDHIMPIAIGGSNTDSNIQLLRKACNLKKSAKHPNDFMRERGFLL